MIQESTPTFISQLKYFWSRRHIVYVWAKYNIYAQYTETRLGFLWILVQPLVTAAIYTIAFNYLLGAPPPRGGVPFLSFYLSGMVPWQLINDCLMESGHIIVSDIELMTQIRFPRESSVFVKFFEQFADFFATFIVAFVVIVIYGTNPNINYLYLPIVVAIMFFLLMGIMLIFSSIGVFIRDLPRIVSPIARVLFFLSGVIFSLDGVDEPYQTILRLNPFIWFIEFFRDIMVYNQRPNLVAIVVLFILSIAVFFGGYRFFKSKEAIFTDYL